MRHSNACPVTCSDPWHAAQASREDEEARKQGLLRARRDPAPTASPPRGSDMDRNKRAALVALLASVFGLQAVIYYSNGWLDVVSAWALTATAFGSAIWFIRGKP